MISRPRIVGFVCRWSLPLEVGAPIASHIPGYPKVRLVRVPCIGRIDPVIVIQTFSKGADGVLMISCDHPDCHYVNGDTQGQRTVKILGKLISLAGLDSTRLRLLSYSRQERRNFGRQVKGFFEEIGRLGTMSLDSTQSNSNLAINMLAAENAVSDFRLRVLLGREEELTEIANSFGEKILPEEFEGITNEIVKEEFVRHKIQVLTKAKPLSVKILAEVTGMKTSKVLEHIVDMRRKNMIALDHIEGTTPLYKASVVG